MATRAQTAHGGGSAKALDYSLKRWPSLSRYADTGHLPIDNNPIDNCIRPLALGKKKWLFVGSERAGRRAAAIQTLLGTAKLNGLNAEACLKNTLEKLPTWQNSRIDELLPLAPEVIEALKQNKPDPAKWEGCAHTNQSGFCLKRPQVKVCRRFVNDPNPPYTFLQSGRIPKYRFWGFASKKQPFVVSASRPSSVTQDFNVMAG